MPDVLIYMPNVLLHMPDVLLHMSDVIIDNLAVGKGSKEESKAELIWLRSSGCSL